MAPEHREKIGVAEGTGTQRVPLLSPFEAELVRRSLALFEEPDLQAVQKELSVSGSVLVVKWTAEDARLLHLSFSAFLDQLSLVLQTIQRIGHQFSPESLPGKGG